MQSRFAAPMRVASLCLDPNEVHRGRRHARIVTGSRPRAGLAFHAPPQCRVGQHRRASSCSASIWKRCECRRSRASRAGATVLVPCRASQRRTHPWPKWMTSPRRTGMPPTSAAAPCEAIRTSEMMVPKLVYCVPACLRPTDSGGPPAEHVGGAERAACALSSARRQRHLRRGDT